MFVNCLKNCAILLEFVKHISKMFEKILMKMDLEILRNKHIFKNLLICLSFF